MEAPAPAVVLPTALRGLARHLHLTGSNLSVEQAATMGRHLPESPAETMQAAAASMADALRSALKLVERTNAETVTKFERRLAPKRRGDDRLHDDCAFDS